MTAMRRVARALGAPLVVRDAPAALDAIIVLGAPLVDGGRLSDILLERARAAAALFHAGAAPIVCATGGDTGAGRSEADAIGDALLELAIPADALRIERASLTTQENAAFTALLLAPDGVRTVWLVTQPFHARRARWHFRRAGFEPRVHHIEDSLQYDHPRRALKWIAREYAAWAVNLVRR